MFFTILAPFFSLDIFCSCYISFAFPFCHILHFPSSSKRSLLRHTPASSLPSSRIPRLPPSLSGRSTIPQYLLPLPGPSSRIPHLPQSPPWPPFSTCPLLPSRPFSPPARTAPPRPLFSTCPRPARFRRRRSVQCDSHTRRGTCSVDL